MKHVRFLKPVLGVVYLLVAATAVTPVVADEKDPSQPIKTLQFQSADIRSVYSFLADYGKVNVVVSPKVEGSVTIRINEVTWRQAMDIVARTYDLAVVEEDSSLYHVLPMVEYRLQQSENDKARIEKQQLADLETKIVKINNSTSNDIVNAVKSLLTQRGKASSDPRSNSIILQEVPENLPRVISLIDSLDKPARQIKISTQLLEISSRNLQELGIDWMVEGTYTTSSGRSYPQQARVDAADVTDPQGSYRVQALQHGWSLEALIEATVTTGKGKIIAHPEISTLENVEAKIQMGQKVPIKQFDDAGNVVIKFEEVGTILTVTPYITAENQILMDLKPERSTFEFDPNGVIINTSNASTKVIVNNGQTAVIGGLTTQDEVETETGIPVLKDIPLLGNLFKYTSKRVETRDLVIFVTPTIVSGDGLAMNSNP